MRHLHELKMAEQTWEKHLCSSQRTQREKKRTQSHKSGWGWIKRAMETAMSAASIHLQNSRLYPRQNQQASQRYNKRLVETLGWMKAAPTNTRTHFGTKRELHRVAHINRATSQHGRTGWEVAVVRDLREWGCCCCTLSDILRAFNTHSPFDPNTLFVSWFNFIHACVILVCLTSVLLFSAVSLFHLFLLVIKAACSICHTPIYLDGRHPPQACLSLPWQAFQKQTTFVCVCVSVCLCVYLYWLHRGKQCLAQGHLMPQTAEILHY